MPFSNLRMVEFFHVRIDQVRRASVVSWLLVGHRLSMDNRSLLERLGSYDTLGSTTKDEEVHLAAYDSPQAAIRGLGRYLDFYYQRRPHQALGYRTPAEVYIGELAAASINASGSTA